MQSKLKYGIGGILIGLVAGFFAANSLNRQAAVTADNSLHGTSVPAGSTSSQPGAMSGDVAEILEKAEKQPDNFAAQMMAGDMYAQIGRFDKAVDFYKRGVALNADNPQANVVLANALFDSQKFEEAETFYAKALTLDPDNVNTLTDLGTTFVERRSPDLERAIGEYKKALAIDPKNATTLYYLGIAHLRKGERGEAEKALQELEKAAPASELIGRLKQNLGTGVPTR